MAASPGGDRVLSKRGLPVFWPLLAALPVLAVLLALGTWQVRRLHWKEAVLEALAESEDAMTSLVKREDQLHALDIALDAGRRTQGSVDQAYRAGAASRIDALLAEAQALSAEGAAIEARQETSRAAVASFRALGGGWTAPTAH